MGTSIRQSDDSDRRRIAQRGLHFEEIEVLDKRESGSRPGNGVVREPLLRHARAILVAGAQPDGEESQPR